MGKITVRYCVTEVHESVWECERVRKSGRERERVGEYERVAQSESV